jgi:uncharacterized protein (DUF2252 family)
MRRTSLHDLAQWQLDFERKASLPAAFATEKRRRMALSPFAFLRGSVPLYHRMLTLYPGLGFAPARQGIIVGDAHLANFGVFEVERKGSRVYTFAINDFDEACLAPLSLDTLRLLASILIARHSWGLTFPEARTLARAALDGYVHGAAKTPFPGRFIRGPRYQDLNPSTRKAIPAAFARYVKSLPTSLRPADSQLEIIDTAFRIAGTGSLGKLRVAVSVRGKKKPWLFDLKAQSAPVLGAALQTPETPAQRVLHGSHTLLGARPFLAGTTTLLGQSVYVRRLAPQEDKLDLARIEAKHREPLMRYLGALLHTSHARGVQKALRVNNTEELLEKSVELAALTEAVYALWLK